MTVSCNGQDDGSGILGSLEEHSFEEIFFGPRAEAFRAALAKGKLPLLTCARCSELRMGGHKKHEEPPKKDSFYNRSHCSLEKTAEEVRGPFKFFAPFCVFRGKQFSRLSVFIRAHLPLKKDVSKNSGPFGAPLASEGVENQIGSVLPRLPHRGLLVENTIACNLACPGCIRPEVVKVRKRFRMSLENIRTVAELSRWLGLETIFFFNRGEPFLSPDIRQEIQLIRELNPQVRIVTSTNGMRLDTDEKRAAALLMDEVIFSIDGCDPQSLQKYQRGGDFARMVHNLRELIRCRDARGVSAPQIEWKYLLFNWNDRAGQIEQAIAQARAAGADLISFWPTNAPLRGISWRYRLGLHNRIGEKSWKGREVRLRPQCGENSGARPTQ